MFSPRPRWLVEHGRSEEALGTLQFYREGYSTPDEVDMELAAIERSVSVFRISGLTWTSLFSDRSLFARMWRAALLQFMAQMCGATAMKYYLPALFKALGFNHRVSLLAGGIESTLKTGCTVLEMLIIDKVGRKITLVAGATVMAFALLVRMFSPRPPKSVFGAHMHSSDQRRFAACLSEQHKQGRRLHLRRLCLHLLPRVQYGLWPCCLGLWLRGMNQPQ